MTVKEFYESIDSSYDEAIARLMKDDRIKKYLAMFAQGDDYNKLINLLEEKNYEEAFRCVHSLKGMCLNLTLSKLANSSAVLCDALRNGAPTVDISDMLSALKADYDLTIAGINALD